METCITITDNDKPNITFEVPEVDITEGGDPVEICYIVDIPHSYPITVAVGTARKEGAANQATDGEDFRTLIEIHTITPTPTPRGRYCFSVETIDDEIDEKDEQFSIVFTNLPSNDTNVGSPDNVCVTIVDDDNFRVEFERPEITAMESDRTVEVCYRTNIGSVVPVEVAINTRPKISSSVEAAIRNVDYNEIPVSDLSFTIQPSNSSSRNCVNITIIDDTLSENMEQFSVYFTNLPNDDVGVGTVAETCVFITDNDKPAVEFEQPELTVNEDDDSVEVCYRTTIGSTNPIEVVIDTRPKISSTVDSAISGTDYDGLSDTARTFTFASSNSSQRNCITFPITDDSIAEGQEQFSVYFTNLPDDNTGVGSVTEACVFINDNDEVSVQFEDPQYTINEEEGIIEVCYNTSGGHSFLVTVEVEATEKSDATNPAIFNADFSQIIDGLIITIPASTVSTTNCFFVPILNDDIAEFDEQFSVQFTNLPSAEAGVGVNSVACVTIMDDEVPQIDVLVPDIEVPEPTGDVEVCLTISTGIAGSIVVDVSTQPKLGAIDDATEGSDYEQLMKTLTFSPSSDGQTICTNATTIDDLIGNEPNEQFSVVFTPRLPAAGVPDVTLENTEVCVNITDDDIPEVKWLTPNVTIPEGTGKDICFQYDIGSAIPYEVIVGTRPKSENPATEQDDYMITSDSRTLVIPASNAGGTQCITLLAVDDDTGGEGNEQLEVFFTNLPNTFTSLATPETVCVTIPDGDGDVTVSFERGRYTVGEGNTTLEICYMTSNGHVNDLQVNINLLKNATSGHVARDGDVNFFAIDPISPHTISASDGQTRMCFNVTLFPDDCPEFDEQFLVQFGELINVDRGDIPEAYVTILDDDDVTIEFEHPTYEVDEGNGSVWVCVETSIGHEFTIEVELTPVRKAQQDEATPGIDFNTEVRSLTFTRQPDVKDGQKKCTTVDIVDDDIAEHDEQFLLTITSTSPTNRVVLGDIMETCITITDNDKPEVKWDNPEVIINEGDGMNICFTTSIGSAQPYDIVVGVAPKSANPASSSDYTITSPLTITVPPSDSGGRFCVNLTTVGDAIVEGDEQLQLTFDNLPNDNADPADPDTVCVTIRERGDFITCRVFEPLQVEPFTHDNRYNFMGTCEYVAFSSCDDLGSEISVTVDFLTESMENGAVGLHVGSESWISRENGEIDQGQLDSDSPYLVEVVGVVGRTNLSFSVVDTVAAGFDLALQIIHTWEGDSPSIEINVRIPMGSPLESCGLCGTRMGVLSQRDGTIATIGNMTQVETFAQSYLVPPKDQSLRPQRRECGTIKNDTVIGDPLYTVPLLTTRDYSLCYEVFGRTNSTLNLISDTCVSVNALYGPMDDPVLGNIIKAVGVKAVGQQENKCYNIRVDLDQCSASVNGGDELGVMERFEEDGVTVRKYAKRVRISAPNCDNVMLVMWIICENRNDQDMIKFVVARGVNLRPSSHGLLGQFWNIPVMHEPLVMNDNGQLRSGVDPEDYYVVNVIPESSPPRRFLAQLAGRTWDKTKTPCLYAGNAQAGPIYEVIDPNDSIIEGNYRDYIIVDEEDPLFKTEYKYSQFEKNKCSSS